IVDMGAYEGPTQAFLLSSESVRVPETRTATFAVSLAMDPGGPVKVMVRAESGDPDITVESKTMLTFDSSNYSKPQTVTLAASKDTDYMHGSALIIVSAPGIVPAGVTATERDSAAPTVLYVDADAPGNNDGISWEHAFNDLRHALEVAAAIPEVKQVRVAQGVYKPDKPSGDREATFQLVNGVAVMGGYAGFGQPDPDARNIAVYETILSGDLNGDDVCIPFPRRLLDDPNNSDNSYHVVTGSGTDSSATLDGFVITAGNADGPYPDSVYGGGLYNHVGAPTVVNCKFIANVATYGGGGVGNYQGSYPGLINCTFSGNSAHRGGALSNYISVSTLINCTFGGNRADYEGGAILSYSGSSVSLTNCILWGNEVDSGSGEPSQISGSANTSYCCIDNDPLFVDPDGADNLLGTKDDDLCLLGGSPCIDAGDNQAVPSSVVVDVGGSPRFVDDPLTMDKGKGMPPIVDIGAYEGPHQGFLVVPKSIQIQEGQPATFTVALAMDPLGTVEVTVAVASGELDLIVEHGDSLTFDSSNYAQPQTVTVVPTKDAPSLYGWATISVSAPGIPGVRVGANEDELREVLYVDCDAQGANNGTCWKDAFTDLREALKIARELGVEQVRVAQGVYRPAGPSGDRKAAFYLISDVAIRGGYAGFGEPNPNARDIDGYQTILSGDLNGDDIEVSDPCQLPNEPTRAENSYHVVTGNNVDETALLDGFTITAGNANGDWEDRYGGGMGHYCGDPTLVNCTFIANTASNGGGVGTDPDDESWRRPTLINCTFVGNAASLGGGVLILDSTATLTDCMFIGNWASGPGGGMYNRGTSTITNCTFSTNSAPSGGGLYNYSRSATLTNCAFTGNFAETGGGVCNRDATSELDECTFSGNSAEVGGAMYNTDSDVKLIQCTVTSNFAGLDAGGMYNYGCDLKLTNCNFARNFTGQDAGAIYNCEYTTGTLVGCTFTRNSAENHGGAIYNYHRSNPVLSNCQLSGNSARECGGGFYQEDCDAMLTNCVLTGNLASWGAGVYNYDDSTLMLTNCTFAANSAAEHRGDAIACDSFWQWYPSKVTVSNCVLWDGACEISNNDGSAVSIAHSDLRGGTASVHDPLMTLSWGLGNIDEYPSLMGDPNDGGDGWGDDAATPDVDEGTNDDFGDLRLLSGSACIDAGDSTALGPDVGDLDSDEDVNEPIPLDLDGHPRLVDDLCSSDTGVTADPNDPGIVDMGAYEFAYIRFGDLDGDCNLDVDLVDFAIFALAWSTESPVAALNLDIGTPADDSIGWRDLAVLAENWLVGVAP
ncbi:MAG: right-handed parallel beta-helix repeat-containing protein, partial [Phycisphaerales bacterium]